MMHLNALNMILLWTLCGAQLSEVFQPEYFQTTKLGETVKIKCLINSVWIKRVWYKLSTSRRLQSLISTNNLIEQNTSGDDRYSVQSSATESNLTIKYTTWEDAGTYYCAVINSYDISFGSGTVVVIEGDSRPMESVVQRPDYIRVEPGDSVTLSCSFITSLCPQEHISVMWMRNKFASEIISWNNGNETITCESRADTGETSCVHNLTLKEVSSAEDGTYLCVVTACGQALFGNGTRIHLNEANELVSLSPTIFILTVLTVVLGVAVIVLVGVVCNIYKKGTTEMDCCSNRSPDNNQVEDGVTYARVNIGPGSAPCRPNIVKHRQDAVVYSEVRNCQME